MAPASKPIEHSDEEDSKLPADLVKPNESTKKRDRCDTTRSTLIMPGRSLFDTTLGKALSNTFLGKSIGAALGATLGRFRRTKLGRKVSPKVASTLSMTLGTPATLIDDATSPPAPPTQAPPVIEYVSPVMLLGPCGAGKTSLVKSWVDRIEPTDEYSPSLVAGEQWSMKMTKKDFCFSSSASQHSVRLQLWDCYGLGPDEHDVKEGEEDDEDWKKVAKTVDTFLLTLSLKETGSSEDICAVVLQWKAWLDEQLKDNEGKKPSVELILTQADCVKADFSSSSFQWMRAGAKLDQICQSCGITSWHVATARYGDIPLGVESVDDLFCSILEKSLKTKIPTQVETAEVGTEEDDLFSPPTKRQKLVATESLQAVPISPEN
jgi:hypothetical protein